MRIKCIDGVVREIIPPIPSSKHPEALDNNIIKAQVAYSGSQAYCNHCRKQLGYLPILPNKEFYQQHICNKHYNHNNQIKRLEL